MRPLFRLVLGLLLAFMFRSPLLRLQQTARQFIQVIPETINKEGSSVQQSIVKEGEMSRPNGTIATNGLELLTFGTPNGEWQSQSHLVP